MAHSTLRKVLAATVIMGWVGTGFAQIRDEPAGSEAGERFMNPQTGLLVGLGSTVVPIVAGGIMTNQSGGQGEATGVVLILVGYLFGGSIGNLYAHHMGGALLSTGIRLTGVTIAGMAYSNRFEDSGSAKSQLGLAAVVFGSYGLSLLTIPASVRRYNRRHSTVTLAPSATSDLRPAARITMSL